MAEPEFYAKCTSILIHFEGESTARVIDIAQLVRLFDVCSAFIATMRITRPEVISQSDRVIAGAYDFIESVCDEVGYAETED